MLRVQQLRDAVRDVPNFPKHGILFRDVTPILSDASLLQTAIDELSRPFEGEFSIAAIESRGFVFGSAFAAAKNRGLHLLRKPGKLPPPVSRREYSLEYGTDALEMIYGRIRRGEKIVLVDDVCATGGTAAAAVELLREAGAVVSGAAFLIDLPDLGGSTRLKDMGVAVHSVITY